MLNFLYSKEFSTHFKKMWPNIDCTLYSEGPFVSWKKLLPAIAYCVKLPHFHPKIILIGCTLFVYVMYIWYNVILLFMQNCFIFRIFCFTFLLTFFKIFDFRISESSGLATTASSRAMSATFSASRSTSRTLGSISSLKAISIEKNLRLTHWWSSLKMEEILQEPDR